MTTVLIRVTLAVQDTALSQKLQKLLARPDILVEVPHDRKRLWDRILQEPADIVIANQSLLPDPPNGTMAKLQKHPDSPAVVVLSDSADPQEHARLLAAGCDAALFAGLAVEQVQDVIEAMLEKRRRLTQKRFFAPRPLAEPRLADFVSDSPSMVQFMKVVPRMVRADSALLIEGETGVGKERLARAMHTEGPRATGNFIALNCGAMPEGLLESELFGHVQGAFTGATMPRRGWFEIANHGTLFLDEVGDIPAHLQVKLLRVLQEHVIQPVGSEKTFTVNVRVIAASNQPLESKVEAGTFRRDLYHRLSVVTITVPPLRKHLEDVPFLVEQQIPYLSKQMSRRVKGITHEALQALCGYSWPGNVRELNNVLERAILLCDDVTIALRDLPESIARPRGVSGDSDSTATDSAHPITLDETWLEKPLHEVREAFLPDLERQYFSGLLRATRGRVGEAARRAGIQARSLYEKMKQLGLRKEDFRPSRGDPA